MKVKTKALVLLTTMSILLVGGMSSYTYVWIKKKFYEDLIDHGVIQIHNLVHDIRFNTVVEDIASLENQINEILGQKDVIGVEVYNKSGLLLVSKGDKKVVHEQGFIDPMILKTTEFEKDYVEIDKKKAVICFKKKMSLGSVHAKLLQSEKTKDNKTDEVIGVAQIFTSLEKTNKDITKNLFFIVIIAVCFIVLTNVLGAVFINIILTPLQNLSKFAVEIGKGNLNQRIEIKSKDEIKDLYVSFQTMLDGLKKLKQEEKILQDQLMQASKLTAIGQLASGVAHEINNPLSVILGFSQSIAKRVKDDDPFAMPLKSIEREAIRCKKIVNDLLTFSRTSKADKEPADINIVITETLSLIETQTKMKNISIIKNFAENLPKPLINKNQIQQVIMNIVSNSMDAMSDGGEIKVTTGAFEENSIKFIEIMIEDTGTGIPKEVIDKIFDPFFTTKEVGKGTGLGLSISYEIIQKHHGAIAASSAEGKGTMFVIKLPVDS